MYTYIIVDDEMIIRQGCIAKLRQIPSLPVEFVGEASNGLEALALIEKMHPDIVITDMKMSGMDGMEFLERLDEQYPNILVIVISGYKLFDYVKQAIEKHAVGYVLKPFSAEEIGEQMRKAIEQLESRSHVQHLQQEVANFAQKEFFLNTILHPWWEGTSASFHENDQMWNQEYLLLTVTTERMDFTEKLESLCSGQLPFPGFVMENPLNKQQNLILLHGAKGQADLSGVAEQLAMGEDFGATIPTIFTDEPQTCHKTALRDPFEETVEILPFTDDFEETFQKTYGVSLLENLPELLWEPKDKPVSQIRYWYHVHVCERFSEAFGDNIGRWCRQHNLALTGHMMNEWTLYSQTLSAGDVMRPMKEFDLPGVDMLCDRRELSTVKQASSVAHQCGRKGVMSELYGVTGWDFDFRNHKLAGDWQAALGVTLRVPHLTWVSMGGEAKRDYPASIGYQSPWYKEYPYIENHFARLNTALTRGKPVVHVGVIHPVESYWLYWGNQRQTSVARQDLESNFTNIIEWLLYNLIDFDFISESILSTDSQSCADAFRMGEMAYDTVIVPECHTLRRTTLMKLQEFAAHRGKVIFMGEAPRYVDARPDDAPAQLAKQCVRIPFRRGSLLEELNDVREIDVETQAVDGTNSTKVKQWESGVRSNNLFYQLRQDGDSRWLFLSHVNRPQNQDVTFIESLNIQVRGEYTPALYDTMTGEIRPAYAEYENGWTKIPYYCSQHDSILFRLEKGKQMHCTAKPQYVLPRGKHILPEPETFQLEEENVLLLDLAEYAFDDGPWNGEEEILRIDNQFREKLGYPLRMEALAQPWTEHAQARAEHTLHMRFRISSSISLPEVTFAMEHPQDVRLVWNQKLIDMCVDGWYVDESIQTVHLPGLLVGENVLELHIPFTRKTNVEWCYLLGDFGVEVAGKEKRLTALPTHIAFGDFVHQGLPFYAGNLIYEVPFTCEAGTLHLEIPQYRGSLVKVELDGRDAGIVALAPYRLNCGTVQAGKHVLKLKLFGNRINAFGAVHNADETEEWYGPNLWRTSGNKWSYEYHLKQTGILTTPEFWVEP